MFSYTPNSIPYDAILFDFDGVLADSEPLHYHAWMEVLKPFGVGLDWETYVRECVGIADRLMIERLASLHTPPIDFDTLWAVYPNKRAALRQRLLADTSVFLPDTIALVRSLADRGVPLAVVSSSGRDEVEAPLVHVGIGAYFKTMVCGHEAKRLKPEPDPYLLAAEILGAKRPLVVEDSDAGVASGKAAGFEVLRIAKPSELALRVLQHLGV